MKRISPATVTFGVMAIVLGLVAAYIVRQALHKPPVAQAPPPKVQPAPPPPVDPGVSVVMARYNLPKNYRLAPEDLVMAYAPRGSKAATAMTYLPAAAGRILITPLKAGQVVREEQLLAVGESLPDLSERLPPGTRALKIDVEGAETGGRRLGEGDLVDIALTVEGTHPDLGEVTTKTLLRNVLVVDTVASRPIARGQSRSIKDMNTLTVAVKPADANKLIVAERTGTLSVALVSAADAAAPVLEDDAINRRELLGLKEIVPPPPAAPVKKYFVEKWRGGSVQVMEMSDDRVRESRDFSATKSEAPATTAAAKPDDKTTYIPSGVTGPFLSLP